MKSSDTIGTYTKTHLVEGIGGTLAAVPFGEDDVDQNATSEVCDDGARVQVVMARTEKISLCDGANFQSNRQAGWGECFCSELRQEGRALVKVEQVVGDQASAFHEVDSMQQNMHQKTWKFDAPIRDFRREISMSLEAELPT